MTRGFVAAANSDVRRGPKISAERTHFDAHCFSEDGPYHITQYDSNVRSEYISDSHYSLSI